MASNEYIFLSYAHKNHGQVKDIIEALQEEGYGIWYDTHLELGDRYNQTIGERIRDCTVFMCILTKEYGESKYCRKEIGLAIETYEKPVVPVYMGSMDSTIPEGIRLLLQGTNAVCLNTMRDALSFLLKIKKTKAIDRCRLDDHPTAMDPYDKLRHAKEKDIVTFGMYWQDFDYKTPIEWIDLEKREKEMLVLSRYALDAQPYNKVLEETTWAEGSLRKWLNENFYDEAFDAEEKRRIPKKPVVAHKNPEYDTDPGIRTIDRLFLLSIPEVDRYFQDDGERMCQPTTYALERGAWFNEGRGTTQWWLRSPSLLSINAAHVHFDGCVYAHGDRVNSDYVAVRLDLFPIA